MIGTIPILKSSGKLFITLVLFFGRSFMLASDVKQELMAFKETANNLSPKWVFIPIKYNLD